MAGRGNDRSQVFQRLMEGITNLSNALADWQPAPSASVSRAAPAPAGIRQAVGISPNVDHVTTRPSPQQAELTGPGEAGLRREFTQLFGLRRGSSSSSSGRARPGRGRGARSHSSPSSTSGCRQQSGGVFYKDIILLDYGAETSPSKLQAINNGRACCLVQLTRHLTEPELEAIIETSFESQLMALNKPRFEFVKVIHHRVVVPTVRRGQMWNGTAIRSLCGQGDLYVRATAPLPVEEEEGTEDGNDTDTEVVTVHVTENLDEGLPDVDILPVTVTENPEEGLPDVGISPVTARDPRTLHRRGNTREIGTPVQRHDASDALINILEEEEDIQEEIQMEEENNVTLKGELEKLSRKIDHSHSNLISVFRGGVMSGALRALRRPTFEETAGLDVVFSTGRQTEGAVDTGGPRKEFFRLVVREILRQKIFEGPPNELLLTLNQEALDRFLYKDCGTLLALSIVHGGPGPRSFSPVMYRRLTSQSSNEANLEDVADYELRSKISKVLDASSSAEFDAAIEDPVVDTIMTLNGLHGPNNTFGNKLEVGRSLIKTIQGNRLEPCFSQLREGLSTLGVLASMRAYPNVWFDLFCVNQAPTSSRELLSLFHCHLSPEGSNQAIAEARTLAWWGDFVADCEAGVTDPVISMADILTFVTCLQHEPAGGFDPSPSIKFTQGRYPEANTCSNVLRLPVSHETYEEFMKKMTEGIIGGQGFGQT